VSLPLTFAHRGGMYTPPAAAATTTTNPSRKCASMALLDEAAAV
jgi:hypothetical protein